MIQGPSGSDCIKSKLFAQGSSRSLLDLTVPPLPGPEFNRAKIRRGAYPLHAHFAILANRCHSTSAVMTARRRRRTSRACTTFVAFRQSNRSRRPLLLDQHIETGENAPLMRVISNDLASSGGMRNVHAQVASSSSSPAWILE